MTLDIDLKLGAIIVAIMLLLGTGVYFIGHWNGSAESDAHHTLKTEKAADNSRKKDAKIKNSAPGDNDRAAGIKFLLEHARQ